MMQDQLNYMYSLERFGIKLGLEVMEALLAELENPHQQFESIHITGTNGKGSTAAMLDSILRAAGFNVALYTSPHLFSFNERIRINTAQIPDQKLGRLIDRVRAAADRARLAPTFFEFTTAVAFCYFAEQRPDVAIIEVGMGGLLDATNVITPRVSVITNVDLDHVPLIGRSKAEIAANKAGVIKPGVPAVTGESDPGIVAYLAGVCEGRSTYLRAAQRELAIESLQHSWDGQTFAVASSGTEQGEYSLQLLGRHQQGNAATALLVIEELTRQGINVSPVAVQRGLAAAAWPGRLELISKEPFVLVDGAHNPQSLEALTAFLIDPATRPASYDVLVVGMKSDKDISVLRDTIAPLFSRVITTEGSYEPMPARQLAMALRHSLVESITSPSAAVERGLELAGERGSLVITGSLYMIPEALAYLQEKLPSRTPKALSAAL